MNQRELGTPNQYDLMNARLHAFPAAIIGGNIAFTLENSNITMQDMLLSAVSTLSVNQLPRKMLLYSIQDKASYLLRHAEPYNGRQLWLPAYGIRIVDVSDPFTWTQEKQHHWEVMMEDVQRFAYASNLYETFDTLLNRLIKFQKQMIDNSARNTSTISPKHSTHAITPGNPKIHIELPLQQKLFWHDQERQYGEGSFSILESGIDITGHHYSVVKRDLPDTSSYLYTIYGTEPIDVDAAIGVASHVPLSDWEPYTDPINDNPLLNYAARSMQNNPDETIYFHDDETH